MDKIKLQQPEVWLRGPVPGIPLLLQPAAHALLQTQEELIYWLQDLPQDKLWELSSGRASVGFHLQHITGVLDRMMTYSKAQKLTDKQFAYLDKEGKPDETLTIAILVSNFKSKVEEALAYFKNLEEKTLIEKRSVGRKELPSTTLGLLFHAAEHSQRHLGQLLVTASLFK